jgi:hypothetical protein
LVLQKLRRFIPTFPYEKRLSKIDALNLAIAYIALLEDLLTVESDPTEYIQHVIDETRNNKRSVASWSTSGQLLRSPIVRGGLN